MILKELWTKEVTIPEDLTLWRGVWEPTTIE